jgi:glycosyltransferase involved in cell wall biosynthesis
MELNTAVKPFMFQHLFRHGHDVALYFDPDIQVFSRLDQILTPLRDGASFVLTPHLCAPAEGDAYPDDIGIMRAGVYNLGFLGVRACDEADAILAWWARRLEYQCISAQDAGIFVDQKFMDLVPGFAENARILRDPTVNVAYWNLAQRKLWRDGETWMVNDRPLGFFHFSGFNPATLDQLARYTVAFRGQEISPTLAQLMEQYAEQLHANRHGSIPRGLYAYGRFASGRRIPPIARKMFRERQVVWPGDPFETYEAYLHAPMPGQWAGSSSAIVTNLMAYLLSQEVGLQQHFDLSQPAGVINYVDWYVRYGAISIGFGELIEPVAERLGYRTTVTTRRPPAKRSAEEADINVIGYLKAAMGVGEAGRLTLRTLNHTGLRARGLETWLNSIAKRTDLSCDQWLEPEANGRFQVFNINCDQLPQVVAHLRPVLRPDAYRIMVPFWELANLPDAWLPAVDEVDEIWAPTRFIQTMLVKKVSKPVIRMPLALEFEQPSRVERSRFRLPERRFLFMFAFDYLSFIERKNPMAVVSAFKRAFRSGGPHGHAQLVLKTLNADQLLESGNALRELIRGDPDIILIEELLSRQDTLALVAACDAVVTLHRSEGLGLLVAEAMMLGKPVISTDYSATTEFVTPETGWPVDYELIPVQEGKYPFHEGQVWADVDIDHAAWQMRQVAGNPEAVRRKTAAARELIARDYSIDAVAQRQLARLRSLEGN